MAERNYRDRDASRGGTGNDAYFDRPAGNGGRVGYPETRNSIGGDSAVDPDTGIYSGMTKRMALQDQGFAPVGNCPRLLKKPPINP